MLMAACAFVLSVTSCGSDDDGVNCIEQTNNVTNAVSNFDFTDFTVENCNSFKAYLSIICIFLLKFLLKSMCAYIFE